MWIVYHIDSQKIVGLSATCEPDLEKDFALSEVVTGLVESQPLNNYDAIQVTDDQQAHDYIQAFPRKLVLRKKGKGALQPVIEDDNTYTVTFESDAPDVHPVDGIPEIPADGAAFTKIVLQKVDERITPKRGKTDNDLIYLRTDFGTLFSDDGKKEINSVKLKSGQAAFRLVSEKAKRVATVQAFNADPNFQNSSVQIEFI